MSDERKPPDALELRFGKAVLEPSDINEHLPMLREYASRCEHVTEIGMRWAGGSTVAFLAAQPLQFVSWDLNPFSVVSQAVADLCMEQGRTRFQPRTGNSLEFVIEPTDMLFIDSLHTAKQLALELKRHADPAEKKIRKYLAFHDTVTFGMQGEDGSTPGLRAALRWFQRNHAFPQWELVEDCQNNNGLVIFRAAGIDA